MSSIQFFLKINMKTYLKYYFILWKVLMEKYFKISVIIFFVSINNIFIYLILE